MTIALLISFSVNIVSLFWLLIKFIKKNKLPNFVQFFLIKDKSVMISRELNWYTVSENCEQLSEGEYWKETPARSKEWGLHNFNIVGSSLVLEVAVVRVEPLK